MKRLLAPLLLLFALAMAVPAQAQLVIAHRGASGERPEHTLAAYELAIEEGADFIEPDLVPTKDGVLVVRHENEISGTTDVADHPEFADRKTTKTIDGKEVTGWFTEDFTLAELETLRARERLPEIRPTNAAYDGLYRVPRFSEIIAMVKIEQQLTGRTIGLYPELKHPSYFKSLGIDVEERLVRLLDVEGYTKASDPVFIQCFEVGTLARLAKRTKLRLVQLVEPEGAPADLPNVPYSAIVTPAGLAGIAQYASAVGADIRMILNPDGSPTSLVADAHAAGLQVHAYTLRRENAFLPEALRNGDDPRARGKYELLWNLLKAAGVDAVFTDNPADAVAARGGPGPAG